MTTVISLQNSKTVTVGATGAKLYGKPMKIIVSGSIIQLPLNTYKNVIIDWGDVTDIFVSTPDVWSNIQISHNYGNNSGPFNIYIYVYDLFSVSNHRISKGQIPHYGVSNGTHIGINNIAGVTMGTLRCVSYNGAFRGAYNLTTVTGKLEKGVKNLGLMFYGCSKFTSAHDLSAWDVSKVTNMNLMFYGCSVFTSDLSRWNTSRVTNMSVMFYNCLVFISNLSRWDVSKVTDISVMFLNCSKFNSNLSKWDVSKVTNMRQLFSGCSKFTSNLSRWDVSSVIDMNLMFDGCLVFNSDLSRWDVSKVTDMSVMFRGCLVFNSNLARWDVSSVIDMGGMFNGCTKFNSTLSGWDVSNVINMSLMFNGCSKFNQDISGWDVSNVTNATNMLTGTAFSVKNYDKLLKSWSKLELQYDITFSLPTIIPKSKYLKYRSHIINHYNWVIQDGVV
jgi:surface protein